MTGVAPAASTPIIVFTVLLSCISVYCGHNTNDLTCAVQMCIDWVCI